MDVEIWVALVAVFVSGGAVGTAGTLLAQWLLRRFDGIPSPRTGGVERSVEVDLLRSEVADLGRHLRNLDARLDFTERLLDGGLPAAPAPTPIKSTGLAAAAGQPDEPREKTR